MLEEEIKKIHEKYDFSKETIFTEEDKHQFKQATNCWICDKLLKDDKVRDHCHFTGKYRGAAHFKCNFQFKKPKFTPVIFHNLANYNSHLFIKNLSKSEGDIKCIPSNKEKYISFSKQIKVNEKGKINKQSHKIRFIDSFKFMTSSLNNLVVNLTKSGLDKLKETEKVFKDQIELISRKGVYPYDYMSSIDKFDETEMPPKEEFYSKLNDCHISAEDYEHAKKVWAEFRMKTMGEYHDLYLKSDVLLLADMFEEFRNVCLENYKLDPAWYYTTPGLAWDTALKVTKSSLNC